MCLPLTVHHLDSSNTPWLSFSSKSPMYAKQILASRYQANIELILSHSARHCFPWRYSTYPPTNKRFPTSRLPHMSLGSYSILSSPLKGQWKCHGRALLRLPKCVIEWRMVERYPNCQRSLVEESWCWWAAYWLWLAWSGQMIRKGVINKIEAVSWS
jgi:hypothetical protein